MTICLSITNYDCMIWFWMLLHVHFTWCIAEAKCLLATASCVSECLSLATFLHYCTDLDVTLGNGSWCLLHCWADLQLVPGFCCYGFVHIHIQYCCLGLQCKSVSINVNAIWTTLRQVYPNPTLFSQFSVSILKTFLKILLLLLLCDCFWCRILSTLLQSGKLWFFWECTFSTGLTLLLGHQEHTGRELGLSQEAHCDWLPIFYIQALCSTVVCIINFNVYVCIAICIIVYCLLAL